MYARELEQESIGVTYSMAGNKAAVAKGKRSGVCSN